jgi:integrase
VASKVLGYARNKGMVGVNVALSASVPAVAEEVDEGERERAWWSPGELARFLAVTTDEPLAGLWALYASTGCRRGEGIALRWSDIAGDVVTIRRNRVKGEGGKAIEGTPKTKHGRRSIVLDARTLELIEKGRPSNVRPLPDAYVFTTADGRPLDPEVASNAFAAVVKRHGLRSLRGLHDVRHSVASMLANDGTPLVEVRQLLGHSSIRVTEGYCHTDPDTGQREAAERRGERLWGAG